MQNIVQYSKLTNHNVFKCNQLAPFTKLRSQLDFKHTANNDGK